MGAHLIDRAKLIAAYINFNTVFNDRLPLAPSTYKLMCEEFPSDSPIEQYKWLGSVPLMQKWIGERPIEKLRAESHQIVNDDWANGIEVERDDLRDDKLGLVARRIRDLADAAIAAIDAQVMARFQNAFANDEGLRTYDGQFLVDTDHTASGAGGTSQSNSGGTTALNAAALEAGIVAMMGFKNDKGEPLSIFPTHLLCGPSLWPTARKLLGQDIMSGGERNLNQGLLQLVVSPRLTGNKWFLVDTVRGIKPVILQVRQQPVFRNPTPDENSMEVFRHKTFFYGADTTFGVGLGMWQTVYGSNAT